jgi:hypothetical protein
LEKKRMGQEYALPARLLTLTPHRPHSRPDWFGLAQRHKGLQYPDLSHWSQQLDWVNNDDNSRQKLVRESLEGWRCTNAQEIATDKINRHHRRDPRIALEMKRKTWSSVVVVAVVSIVVSAVAHGRPASAYTIRASI